MIEVNIKVSVIVPVYNVEKYLEKCLNSLIEQTLEDIEIIVVNDGSPDNSQDIIDIFAKKHPGKIVAVRQENRGLGPARNSGVSHARGEYIGYVDSDDWVRPDMFELLYNAAAAGDCDVVICDFYRVNEESGECKVICPFGEDGRVPGTTEGLMRRGMIPAYAWNKLYRKSLAENTPFPDNHDYFEDMATTPVILSYCKKISYVNEPLYYYLKRGDSITAQQNNPKNLGLVKGWERCLTECNRSFADEVGYAVYFYIGRFLTGKIEHMEDFLVFFWKNEEQFKRNKYINEDIRAGGLIDLFSFMAKAGNTGSTGDSADPYVKNLVEFMEDTQELIEQLDNLPQATLAELAELYSIAVLSATENVARAGPKLLVQLNARFDKIRRKIEE